MASEQFRRQLQQEAEQWQVDGLIDTDQYQRLADRYEFGKLDLVARDRFIAIVIGLGSVLLGLSVITFVAANWQAIPRELKLALLLALLIGVNAIGFYLWQRPRPSQREGWPQRLGQGLLLLGGLILGANMALLGQLFHISGSIAGLCIIWGLAVLAMAYGLRLLSLGALAILLVGIGYWSGMANGGDDYATWVEILLHYMPLLAAGLFLPLAYFCRSRILFTLGAIAIFTAFSTNLSAFSFALPSGLRYPITLLLPIAFLWSYDDTLWQNLIRRNRPQPDADPVFQPIAKGLALLCLTVLLYVLSFHGFWDYLSQSLSAAPRPNQVQAERLLLFLNPNFLVFLAVTLFQWSYLARPRRRPGWRFSLMDGTILAFIGILTGLLVWQGSQGGVSAIATFLVNLLLFLLAAGYLREGLAEGQRRLFWSGMILLTLQILSRLLEYETGLLLKSLAFLLCGIGIILIGLWFERHIRTLRNLPTSEDSR